MPYENLLEPFRLTTPTMRKKRAMVLIIKLTSPESIELKQYSLINYYNAVIKIIVEFTIGKL